MFLASFSHFQDTYGIIGSALVLLIWLTMFSVLYYVTPDLRALGGGGQGARALAAAVTWLAVCAALAVCLASLDSSDQTSSRLSPALSSRPGCGSTNGIVLRGVRLSSQGRPP